MEWTVPHVDDFALTGHGDAAAWRTAPWRPLTRVGDGPATYATRARMLWSDTGLYVLVDAEDQRISCTLTTDFADLFREDVVELFLHPHEAQSAYIELEISPLGVELPLLVTNHGGSFHGWLPWHYEGDRRIRKATSARGGPLAPGASVTGWTVEAFVPFALLRGLGNTPPESGTRWRANLYRIDTDEDPASQWAWCAETGSNFHDFKKFGTVIFADCPDAPALRAVRPRFRRRGDPRRRGARG